MYDCPAPPLLPYEGDLPTFAYHLKPHNARFSIAVVHAWPPLIEEVALYIWLAERLYR